MRNLAVQVISRKLYWIHCFGALYPIFFPVSVLAASTQLAEEDLKLITTALREVSKWHQLGIQLGLSPGLLHTIESNHPRDADRCKTEVLTWWLRNAEQRSWDKIAEALDKIEYKVLAVKLERKSFQG